MPRLKGSQTATNLMISFAGESQANMRYTYYEKVARYEGYEQIGDIFAETAKNERAHAERFYKLLREELASETVEISNAFPVNYSKTPSNLAAAFEGEEEESEKLYPSFAKTAEEEGFPIIAEVFRNIAQAEKAHKERFFKLYENFRNNRVFKRDEDVLWKCGNCGYIFEGKEPPITCPACLVEQSYFELFVENY